MRDLTVFRRIRTEMSMNMGVCNIMDNTLKLWENGYRPTLEGEPVADEMLEYALLFGLVQTAKQYDFKGSKIFTDLVNELTEHLLTEKVLTGGEVIRIIFNIENSEYIYDNISRTNLEVTHLLDLLEYILQRDYNVNINTAMVVNINFMGDMGDMEQ